MNDIIKINDQVSQVQYGLTFLDGTYTELLKPAKPKERFSNNWRERHGTERDVTNPKLESRTLTLPVMIEGSSENDFLSKHQSFTEWIQAAGYFNLKSYRLNRAYSLLYADATDYIGYATHCTFKLVLTDDFPHIITAIA